MVGFVPNEHDILQEPRWCLLSRQRKRGLMSALATKKKGFDVVVFEKDLSAVRGERLYIGFIHYRSGSPPSSSPTPTTALSALTSSGTLTSAATLTTRNFGIGADGVIFALPGINDTNYTMRIYNSNRSESKYLQNDQPDIIPQEDRAVKHVLDSLLPLSTTTGGGPLVINHEPTSPVEATSLWSTQELFQGRSCHLLAVTWTFVTANPKDWEFNSSSVSIE